MSKQFLWSFHYFRAFAILSVVASHVWVLPNLNSKLGNTQRLIKELFFHDSTIYFVFISGFLIMHLKEKITTSSYYISKVKNILIPYTLICIFLLFVNGVLGEKTEVIDMQFVKDGIYKIISGNVFSHLWYIPFITLIFIVTPFLVKLPESVFVKITPILLLLPLLGTRSGTEINLGQYLYFFPIYLFGMFVRVKLDVLHEILKNNNKSVLFLVIGSFALLFVLLKNHELTQPYQNYHEGSFYLNRLLIILFFIGQYQAINHNGFTLFSKIADYSFALYFIHPVVAKVLSPIYLSFLENTKQVYWFLISIIFTLIVIALCMVVIRLTKYFFGKKSKLLIGY